MVDSKEIIEKDNEYITPTTNRRPIVIQKGKGAILWDLEGKEYIDCLAGLGVVNTGHTPDRIINAAMNQLYQLFHCSGQFYSVPQTLLAEKLASITPKLLKKTFFCNSGSEAVEGAVKIAKKFSVSKGSSGTGVISLEGSFHGRLSLSLSLTGQSKYKKGFGSFANSPGVVHAPAPYCYRCQLSFQDCNYECARKIEDLIKFHSSGDIAAMILEPVMGDGGIIVPPEGYHAEVQKICKKHEILLIADEVQSGFGRCGEMFASEVWGINPDIMTMAKGLGAGLPIGAVIYTDEVVNCLEKGDHFSTFGGNPVSCAVALESINFIEENHLIDNSRNLGLETLNHLQEMKEEIVIIGDVRGKGLFIGIELVKDENTKEPAIKEAQDLVKRLMKSGILVGSGGISESVIRIHPPLCINKEQMTFVLQQLEVQLKEL